MSGESYQADAALKQQMKRQHIKVLLVEDDEDDVFLAREYLSESTYFDFTVDWEPSIETAKSKLLSNEYQVCLVDYRLENTTGLDLISFVKKSGQHIPIILLTGHGDREVDLEAMRIGAADYLVKGEMNGLALERSIRYALSHASVIMELEAKEKRYRLLFERSIDPIFLANEEFQLIDINASMEKLFACADSERSAINLKEIFFDAEEFENFKHLLRSKGHVRDFEVTLKTYKGDKLVCLVNCVFISDLSSSYCCYQGIIHDLTMRKKAERELVMAEKLLMTGKIARTIAHEVRNPLTNLNLALEQLKDEMPDSESAELYTGIISRNANRIEQLISEMLNSSKLKELNIELVPVNLLIEETIVLILDRINLNQMKLLLEIQEDLPRILVDKEKIKIALLNILINGIEAMKPGEGILKISVSKLENRVVISIADNGTGIAEEELDKLFDPFYTAKPGGMGLGLTSTQNILKSHSAAVEVASELGKGTTFRVIFSLSQ